MAQLYIPAKREIKGPWLLTVDELEALDKTLNAIEQKIDEAAEKHLEAEAEEVVRKGEYPNLYPDTITAISVIRERNSKFPSDKRYRFIELVTVDDKKLTDNSIMNIIKDPKTKNLSFKKLSIKINNTGNNFNLEVSDKFDGELSCSANCSNQSAEYDIIYDIDTWIEKHKPTRIQQIWSNYWFFFSWISFCFAFFLFFQIVDYKAYDYRPAYKKELNNLLTKGVTEANQAKVIELLAKYEMNYLPSNLEGKEIKVTDKNIARAAVIFLFLCIASLARPKTTIGIGSLKNVVNRYRLYQKIIFVIIPTSILLPPIYSLIRQFLGFK